jgi:hypothetical protein
MKTYWTIYIAVLVLSILGVIGWFVNIAKLVGGDMVISGEFILRIIGIFAFPLGGIMGYL